MVLRDVRGALASYPELTVTPAGRILIDVKLGRRGHRVRVLPAGEWLRVEGKIVLLEDVEGAPGARDLAEKVRQANSRMELVGLARDEDNWLVARYDVPPEAEADELVEAILRVARVADRWELLWVGGDLE